ncbi:MAG: hypothetical protein JXA22_02510 [Candidatus Thermoplasmatota archaeon]|nr:hypothetical protein [Candidatus Thermoplasmatota archaeon]
MADEDNPFMVSPKPVKNDQERTVSFGTDEEVSFMVAPGGIKERGEQPMEETRRPNWERSGTPVWDKKNVNVDNPDYEVVEHGKDQ